MGKAAGSSLGKIFYKKGAPAGSALGEAAGSSLGELFLRKKAA